MPAPAEAASYLRDVISGKRVFVEQHVMRAAASLSASGQLDEDLCHDLTRELEMLWLARQASLRADSIARFADAAREVLLRVDDAKAAGPASPS